MRRTLAVFLLLSAPAWAEDLSVTGGFSRATSGSAPGAAYVTIRGGDQPDRLVSISSPEADHVAVHTMVRDGEVMRMRELTALDIPAHGTVQLQPGGLHLMLEGLHAPLRQGSTVVLTLQFERAGAQQVSIPVQAPGAMAPGHSGH